MAELEFHAVSKRFADGTDAVEDLNLRVRDGEFMIFVGPSGCGKTTALRMIAGLESPTGGEITIGGHSVTTVDPGQRDIAMVFQDYALYPQMRVRDNIAFPLKMRKADRGEVRERVAEVARLLGIEHLLDRKPGQLSGGQRQRVAIGRAIVRRPQAFLLDEPLSNLDAKLRVMMRAELIKLQQQIGVTTVFVTHDQVEAMTLGQRVAVMRDGRLQQVGPPQQLYHHPRNTFVAAFLGSPPMNFTHAALADGTLVVADERLALPDAIVRRLARGADGPVILGLRPEAFHDAGLAGDAELPTLAADVEITEQLGPETHAYVRIAGWEASELTERPPELAGTFAARLDPRSAAAPGVRLRLAVDLAHCHLFAPQSGETILAPPDGEAARDDDLQPTAERTSA